MTFAHNIVLIDESSEEMNQSSNYEELYKAINIQTPFHFVHIPFLLPSYFTRPIFTLQSPKRICCS